MKCTNCGNPKAGPWAKSLSLEVDGHTISGKVPATKCDQCGEVQFGLEDLRRFNLVAASRLAAAGASSGHFFKFQRKALGLKASELGEMLDTTAETISRWETGERSIPRTALVVVATLVEDALGERTAAADKIRVLGKPKHIAKRFRIDLLIHRPIEAIPEKRSKDLFRHVTEPAGGRAHKTPRAAPQPHAGRHRARPS